MGWLDGGPIVAQAAVPVLTGDTVEALEARILAVEHRLYPHAVRLIASGAAQLSNGRVTLHQGTAPARPLEAQQPPLDSPIP